MAVGGDREILLQCYNFGCGKTFNPATITDTSCCFHPGHPVFHDALKGWSCCKKRTTDFTEFMNIPGCTRERCSNVKPEQPEKEAKEEVKVQEVVNKPIEKPEERRWWGEEVDEGGNKKFLQSEEGGCQGGRRCFWWNQNWDNVLQQRSVWMFCVILFYILKWFFFKNDQIQFFFSQLFKFN